MQFHGQREKIIVNHNFIKRLEQDIMEYDILFICAPLGWEKNTLLAEVYQKHENDGMFWLEETKEASLEEQIKKLPGSGKRVLLIPHLERVIEQGQQELIWELLSKNRKDDVFVFASTVSFPENLLPYTLLNRCIVYEVRDLRPTNEDIDAYMRSRGVSLTEEQLLCIEKDCDNMPLVIRLLANLLCSTGKAYCRSIREQCFEDVYTYIDVVFFRTFSREEQNALLKLSCFERIDYHLITYILNLSPPEVRHLMERLLNKGSVLQKDGEGWSFYPLFQQFLQRMFTKYFDYQERQAYYQKVMNYFMKQEQWLAALPFTRILQDTGHMAECLEHFLSGKLNYDIFLELELYFQELTAEEYRRYPELLISASMLAAILGDVEKAKQCEQLFLGYLEQTKEEKRRQKLYGMLLNLYMVRPGCISDDFLAVIREALYSVEETEFVGNDSRFVPNYMSVLHGEKDYCRYFTEEQKASELTGGLTELAERLSDRGLSLMLQYMKAEVFYEKNDLDQAVKVLAKTVRDAKIVGNDRVKLLCTVKMLDLLMAKNQFRKMDAPLMEVLESEKPEDAFFVSNCRAHLIGHELQRGNRDEIRFWMEHHAPNEFERFYSIQYYQYLIKAKVYLWMEEYVRTDLILQVLSEFAGEYKMDYLEKQIRILKAILYFREGNSQWKETLMPALEWGKRMGFIRIFADEGAAVYELLNELAQEVWTG